ncbi:MAG: hypothetical protein KHX56_00330 [Clostridiales bacterium]|nr:hypothetical protein [Clostridiales bacterium]
MMTKKKTYNMAARLGIYFAGLWIVSLGIVLCKKCGFGISPISCVPFVLESVVPLSFGMLTMIFHLVNILIQAVLKKGIDIKLVLQVPVAVLFGWGIDLLQKLIVITPDMIALRVLALVFSVFFTALGMLFMVSMNLVQNPPDGTVKMLSIRCRREFGTVKIAYDVVCVAAAAALGLIFLGKLSGIGIATIVSALFVGRTVSWLRGGIKLQCF